MSQQLVLVTGITGFIAGHVTERLIEQGYRVRGTVRSAKYQKLSKETIPGLEFTEVNDLASDDLTEALKDINAVIHVASPFTGSVTDPKKDMLDPAIEGTLNVVRSAHKAGVKRIIITSSFVAVCDVALGGAWRDHTYTANDWNPATYEEAIKGDKSGLWVYFASKALAEKAAFDYAKRNPVLEITTVNPPYIFGPPEQSALNTSSAVIYQLISGQLPEEGLPLFVDVRDVAQAHVLALKNKSVIGKRVLLSGGPFTFYETVKLIAEKRPELKSRLPSLEGAKPVTAAAASKVDTSIAEELGLSFTPYEKCLFDTIDALLEKEKKGGSGL